MKKGFLLGAAMLLTVTVVTTMASLSRSGPSNLLAANIEALTNREDLTEGETYECYFKHFDSGASGYYFKTRYCGDCGEITAEHISDRSDCIVF